MNLQNHALKKDGPYILHSTLNREPLFSFFTGFPVLNVTDGCLDNNGVFSDDLCSRLMDCAGGLYATLFLQNKGFKIHKTKI